MKATIDGVTYEGTQEEVRLAVKNHIETIGRSGQFGGYVFPVSRCDETELIGGKLNRPDYSRLG